jgi:hypothetical protein
MLAIMALACAHVQAGEFVFDTPADDRWHYPHNFTPGSRPLASVFGGVTPDSNDRRAYNVIAWTTLDDIDPGLDPENYHILGIEVSLRNNKDYADWPIDVTADEWYTTDHNHDGTVNADGIPRGQPGDVDGESDDVDPGRPIELFGAGFGPTYDLATWDEADQYIGDLGNASDPFPFVYGATPQEILHVENHVRGLHNQAYGVYSFTPTPWAIGQPVNYTPGSQTVDFDVEFTVDLSLSDCDVRRYFQEQLDQGRVAVIISSLQEAEQQTPVTEYNRFYLKEAVPLGIWPDAKAPELIITLSTIPGDFDGDDDVDADDVAFLNGCSTGPALGPPTCECEIADLDDDEDVDQSDLGLLQRCISGTGNPGDENCLELP